MQSSKKPSWVNCVLMVAAKHARVWIVAAALVGTASAANASYYTQVSTDPDLIAYWRLGESTGPTAAEVTGNSNGTYINVAGGDFGQPGAIASDPDTAVNGVIDEPAVLSRALTGSEVLSLYQAATEIPEPASVALLGWAVR
jgi:hypothetical protein